MDNTTAILARHRSTLDDPATLVVDAADPALVERLPRARLHSDRFDPGGRFRGSPLPELSGGVERVVVIQPKAKERLAMLLAVLAGQTRRALPVWLVGPTRGGIRGGVTQLRRQAEEVRKIDNARHCQLFEAVLPPGPAVGLTDFARHERAAGLELVSYPGVFSHGRLDEGTAELLAAINDEAGGQRVLELGCGAGLVSAALARAGHAVTAVDVSATAVAATRATLAANGYDASVHFGDLYTGLGRFDAVWSNPPFHEGIQRTLAVTENLIREAPAHLEPGGTLTLVANRELAYPAILDEAFGSHRILRESNRFRVYRAVCR